MHVVRVFLMVYTYYITCQASICDFQSYLQVHFHILLKVQGKMLRCDRPKAISKRKSCITFTKCNLEMISHKCLVTGWNDWGDKHSRRTATVHACPSVIINVIDQLIPASQRIVDRETATGTTCWGPILYLKDGVFTEIDKRVQLFFVTLFVDTLVQEGTLRVLKSVVYY